MDCDTAPPVVIETVGLTKDVRDDWTLKRRPVLRGVDLEVRAGEVFGFLGVNGAGKTTTLQCLVGLTAPSGGAVRVAGGSPTDAAVRRRLGFLPERPYFYDHLTGAEFLGLVGDLCGMSPEHRRQRIKVLAEQLHLRHRLGTPLRKLSKGELQRFGIAQAVLHEPDVVILDEPMSGLDPLGRRDVRDLIEGLRAGGRTVLFSSHVVPDVEALCDRVAVLQDGVVLRTGRIEEITSVSLKQVDLTLRNVPGALLERLLGPADTIQELGTVTRVRIHDPDRVDRVVVRSLQAGGHILALERRRERLEEYLVRATEAEAA